MPRHFDPAPEFIIDTYKADEIEEATSAAGVTIDGVLLKDGVVSADVISEKTSAAGVTVDGVLLKDSAVTTDTINEKTSAAGVTIDNVLLKDGTSNGRFQTQTLTSSGAITVGRRGIVGLAHNTVVIAATLAAPAFGDELHIVNTSASGEAAHTVTCAEGVTFDGTNDVATLNAPGEALYLIGLSATRWLVVVNNGSVSLSASGG